MPNVLLDLHKSNYARSLLFSLLSRVLFFLTLWSEARQAPLSMGFSRQEYWSGLPFPRRGGLPNPGTEPWSLPLQADSLLLNHQGSPGKEFKSLS